MDDRKGFTHEPWSLTFYTKQSVESLGIGERRRRGAYVALV